MGLLQKQQKQKFSGGQKPECLVEQCKAMAFLGLEPGASAQALAACQDMCALLKQSDAVEHKRALLKKRINTLAKALQVSRLFQPWQKAPMLWPPLSLYVLVITCASACSLKLVLLTTL